MNGPPVGGIEPGQDALVARGHWIGHHGYVAAIMTRDADQLSEPFAVILPRTKEGDVVKRPPYLCIPVDALNAIDDTIARRGRRLRKARA